MTNLKDSSSIRERLAGSLVTNSCREFLDAADNDVALFVFVSQQLDVQAILQALLAEFGKNYRQRLTPDVVVAHLSAMREMVFCRYVENMLVYLADILREVLAREPAIMSSSERLTVERLVKAGSLEELIVDVIDDKVASLTHAGYKELSNWFADRKIPLGDGTEAKVEEYVALRNVLVHNRGRADDRFLKSAKAFAARKGERIHIDTPYVGASAETLGQFVSVTDALIATKFRLERSPY